MLYNITFTTEELIKIRELCKARLTYNNDYDDHKLYADIADKIKKAFNQNYQSVNDPSLVHVNLSKFIKEG